MHSALTLLLLAILASPQSAKPRARDLGVPFESTPGRLNAITDVAGVEVGFTTLIEGDGALQVGKGPVRTGVTAVLPRGKASTDPVMAGWFSTNGNVGLKRSSPKTQDAASAARSPAWRTDRCSSVRLRYYVTSLLRSSVVRPVPLTP